MSKNLRSPSLRVGLRSTNDPMKYSLVGLAWLGVVSLCGKPAEKDVVEITDLGLRLFPIMAGKFRMGDDRVADIVKPYLGVRQVQITKNFHLGETEVTQRAWQAIMPNNPSEAKGLDLPVEQVTWNQAAAFCSKLTERERNAGRLPRKKVYRLPTEAEWEYTALAGAQTTFFFGNATGPLKQYAWFNENAESRTHVVGTKRANPFGIRDIYGNVREWCLDGYSPRPKGILIDPLTGPHNPDKVNRGGSYDSCAECCKTFNRTNYGPGYQAGDIGFRLVLGTPHEASAP